MQRRRDQVTWVATLSGSLARDAAKLSLDHRTTNGHSHLVFNAKNVHLTNPRQAPTGAGLLLTGSRMKFSADPKCPNQSKATGSTYRRSSDTLTVKEVDHNDSCALRARTLTSRTWTKGP